jgi:glycerol uptake facilitator-like aquaporin
MSNFDNAIIEFIGTFVFLSVIYNVAMKGNGTILTPFAIGLALTVAIYMVCNGTSACHFNPAVSFMAWCKGDLALIGLAMFIVAQLLGAGCAWAMHTRVLKA